MTETCPNCGRPQVSKWNVRSEWLGVGPCGKGEHWNDGRCATLTIERLRQRVAELEAQLALKDEEFAAVAARAWQHSQEDWEHLEEVAKLALDFIHDASNPTPSQWSWMQHEHERWRQADVFRPLSPEEIAQVKPVSEEAIREALRKGGKDVEAVRTGRRPYRKP